MHEDQLHEELELSEKEETETQEDVDVLELARQYAILHGKRKSLEEDVDKIKEEMAMIECQIAEKMLFDNPRLRVKIGEHDGKGIFKTVHVISKIRTGHNGDRNALIQAMKESGYEALVSETFNYNSLDALISGFDENKTMSLEELMEEVPEPMRPHLKISRVTKLGCRS